MPHGSSDLLRVVGIGASAGGLEALQELFRALPADTGGCFIVVQHLSPDFRSLMDELLGRCTTMPVRVAGEGTQLAPNTVLLIPPGKNLVIDDLRVHVIDQPSKERGVLNLPIDLMLRSLAKTHGDRSVACILSGSGSDGARGVRDVAAAGGVVLVQEPLTARFDGMPRAAIRTGAADVIDAPKRLASPLADQLRFGTLSPPPPEEPVLDQDLQTILGVLRERHDVELAGYKRGTLTRRVEQRVSALGVDSLESYLPRFVSDLGEQRALLSEILVGVTAFFRDGAPWERLHDELVERVIPRLSTAEELRIWVCACSTGEEAYTAAMVGREALEACGKPTQPLRVIGTDLSPEAISVASAGVYPRSVFGDLGESRLARWFELHGDTYRVGSVLRRQVIFAAHDALRQTPFSRMHVVTCRNLLIYLEPELQQRLIRLLHYALQVGGLLLLGSAEGPHGVEAYVDPLCETQRIYLKTRSAPAPVLQAPRRRPQAEVERDAAKPPKRTGAIDTEQLLERVLEVILDKRHATGLVVSRSDELVHLVGESPGYLRLRRGAVKTDLRSILPRELALSVHAGLQRCHALDDLVLLRNVRFEDRGERYAVDVRCYPGGGDAVDFVLLAPELPAEPSELTDLDVLASERIEQLEVELQQTRTDLQTTIEELEATNEEQQATNEELVASNEELQSVNEEIQSVNEELYSVNEEHQQKIRELYDLNADLDGLLRALDVGVVFLDADMAIRRFNPHATHLFRLRDVDVGRHLEDIADLMDDGRSRHDLLGALAAGQEWSGEVSASGHRWRVSVQHVVTSDDSDTHYLCTIVDVDRLHGALERARLGEQRLRTIADNLPDVIWQLSADRAVEYVSSSFERVFGRPVEWALGAPGRWIELVHPDDRPLALEALRRMSSEDELDLRLRTLRADGAQLTARIRSWTLRDERGARVAYIGILTDVTEAARAEREREQTLRRLQGTIRTSRAFAYARPLGCDRIEWLAADTGFLGYRPGFFGDDEQALLDLVHPADRERVRAAHEAFAAEPSGAMTLEFRLRRADGSYGRFRDRAAATRDADGRITEVIGVLQDISEASAEHHALVLADARAAATMALETIGHWEWHLDSGQWSGDARAAAWLDLEAPDASGRFSVSALEPDDLAQLRGRLIAATADGVDLRVRTRDGRRLRLVGRAHDCSLDDSRTIVGIVEDETGRETLEAKLHAQERYVTDILAALPVAVTLRDEGGQVLVDNPAATAFYGQPLEGRPIDAILSAPERIAERDLCALARDGAPAIASDRRLRLGDELVRVCDSTRVAITDPSGAPVTLAVDEDVTERWERSVAAQERIDTDPLTGLLSRSCFVDRLEHAIERCRRDDEPVFSVLFLDFDGFKEINDSYGHLVGDQLLVEAARRIRGCARPGDSVARFGGDEYAVLLESCSNYRDAVAICRRIHATETTPIEVDGHRLFLSASVGVAMYDPARGGAAELLRDADVAMYAAKERGHGSTSVFNAEMHADVLKRLETKNDLREAVARDELTLHLQPMFAPRSLKPVGLEALVRWNHPTRGLLYPGSFLPLARETNIMLALEAWVADHVLALVAQHGEVLAEHLGGRLSFNVSPEFLGSEAFATWLDRAATRPDPGRVQLVVEITEQALMHSHGRLHETMRKVRAAGVELALDDFGTGYSSLSYLHRLEIDELKVDRSFTERAPSDPRTRAILETVVELGRKLGMRVVVEGVETREQMRLIQGLDVAAVQGFLLGRPVPIDAQLRADEGPRAAPLTTDGGDFTSA